MLLMAGVAQLVRAPVCGTGGRRFKTGHSPHFSSQLMGKPGSLAALCCGLRTPNILKQMKKRGRGGIGRRAGFRYQWRESWGFESLRPHHLTGPNDPPYLRSRVTGWAASPAAPEGFSEIGHGTWFAAVNAGLEKPIWPCCHITKRPKIRSWQDKG